MHNKELDTTISQLTIVETADGSKTIYNPQVGENYHSRNGALQESEHVFLNSGLRYFLADKAVTQVSVLEVGFGTGLNFLLSAAFCTSHQINLQYTGIEAYPLTQSLITQTGYQNYVPAGVWEAFTESYTNAINNTIGINPYISLNIAYTPLISFQSQQQFDVIYFDAFASANQPEMWSTEAINHTIQFLKPGGVFVTYAITGNLKRQLKALGLKIEKVAGAAGKREMLRATSPSTRV